MSVCGLLSNLIGVTVLVDAEGESNQVCGGSHEQNVERVAGVEGDGSGGTFGARPEGVSVLVRVILGEDVQKIQDLVVEQLLEVLASHLNTLGEVGALFQVNQLLDLLHSLSHS